MATPPAKLDLTVEVIGSDVFGQQFFEDGQTQTVYPNGLSVRLASKLARDSEVIVRNPETNVEAVATVLGQIRGDTNGEVYGFALANPPSGFWRVGPAAGRPRTVALECCACHSVASVALCDIELEIFEATQELSRACEKCKSSRIWREAKGASLPQPVRDLPEAAPSAPPPVETAQDERRKTKRMPMKAPACIRHGGVEVIVTCEDVSKGGFRFLSPKKFPEGTRFEAAVPYTKFGNNIFSHANVAYCRALPDGQFRHGVAYIKTSGSIGWDSGEHS